MFIVLLILIAVIVGWLIVARNGLVAQKYQVGNAWRQIDVQLKRRHDLIPNLVASVKGAMQHERDTLERVIAARNQAITAQQSGNVASTAAAEAQLGGALNKLLAVVEAYPDLKANANVAALQEELASTENKIGFARQLYNDTATQYNIRQQQFPTNLVAGLAGASPVDLWEIEDGSERASPTVDLTLGPPSR
ncbi:MAG TPA: LemA family protein [Gemmatimonadaceae bacterium]